MATDLKWLQGKIVSDPPEVTDLDRLLAGFLRALIEERRLRDTGVPTAEPQSGAV